MESIWLVLGAAVVVGVIARIVIGIKNRRSSESREETAPALHYSTSFKTPGEPDLVPKAPETQTVPEKTAEAEPLWTCSFCGSKNPQSAKVCPRCGGEREQPKPVLVRREAESGWTCHLCGAKNPLSKEFCPSCGTKKE